MVLNSEYPFVRWLERNGYDVVYWSGVDTHRRGELLLGRPQNSGGGGVLSAPAAGRAGRRLEQMRGGIDPTAEVPWNDIDGPDDPGQPECERTGTGGAAGLAAEAAAAAGGGWSGTATAGPGDEFKPRLFLSVGHDEYWSGQQRRLVEQARDAGVHLGFFSGNEMYWRIRESLNGPLPVPPPCALPTVPPCVIPASLIDRPPQGTSRRCSAAALTGRSSRTKTRSRSSNSTRCRRSGPGPSVTAGRSTRLGPTRRTP